MTQIDDTALSYSNVFEAALYFDYVVPISPFFDYTFLAMRVPHPSLVSTVEVPPREFMLGLLPPAVRNNDAFLNQLAGLYRSGSEVFIRWMEQVQQKVITTPNLTGFDSWLHEAKNVAADFGLAQCPVITHPGVLPEAMCDESLASDFAATMTSMHLIDANKLSWAQIEEFRKDRTSRVKLRRLRLFFVQNYTGKDRRYVEDDLCRLLDEYERTVQSWGFETRAQVVSMLLSSKWVAGGVGGSVFSALAGAPMAALVTAAGGLSIEIGNIVLEVTKRKHALRKLTYESPISYVVDLQNATLDVA